MPPLCKVRWQPERLTEGLLPSLHETRRNPLAKEDCIIANWLRHRRTTGRRRNAANRMQSIRGKRQKEAVREFILSTALFSFSLCPWCCFSSPQLSCGNNPVRYDCMSHTGCRGDTPAAGVQGARSPLLRQASHQRSFSKKPLFFHAYFEKLASFFTKRAYYDKVIARIAITLIVWREGCE